jgi:hypothetical protein
MTTLVASWPRYRFVHVPSKFVAAETTSEFQAPSDESAGRYCALLTEGVLRVVIPGSGGICKVRPLRLIAVNGERLVRDFTEEQVAGWDFTCKACNALMTASREGWQCPKCHCKTGWV